MGEKLQIRAEMEWPDAHTVVLPTGWRWSDKCFWVVNSDGIACDPQRRLVKFGGQVHTPITSGPDDLASRCAPLFESLMPVPNYRSTMRVSVRLPDLRDDVRALKRLLDYTHRHLPRTWSRVDPLEPMIDLGPAATEAEHRGAHNRLTAAIRARHYLLPSGLHAQRMKATTVHQLLAPEVTVATSTGPVPSPLRETVDIRHVQSAGWITLRCFAQAADDDQVHAAAGFALAWIKAALSDDDPARPVNVWHRRLPRQLPYRHDLEKGWQATNFYHNSRQSVAARLADMGFGTDTPASS